MDCIVAEVKKEFLVLILLNESNGLIPFSVGQVFTLFSWGESGDAASSRILIIGIEVRGRLPDLTPTDVDVETLFIRLPVRMAEMPFSDVACHISR